MMCLYGLWVASTHALMSLTQQFKSDSYGFHSITITFAIIAFIPFTYYYSAIIYPVILWNLNSISPLDFSICLLPAVPCIPIPRPNKQTEGKKKTNVSAVHHALRRAKCCQEVVLPLSQDSHLQVEQLLYNTHYILDRIRIGMSLVWTIRR